MRVDASHQHSQRLSGSCTSLALHSHSTHAPPFVRSSQVVVARFMSRTRFGGFLSMQRSRVSNFHCESIGAHLVEHTICPSVARVHVATRSCFGKECLKTSSRSLMEPSSTTCGTTSYFPACCDASGNPRSNACRSVGTEPLSTPRHTSLLRSFRVPRFSSRRRRSTPCDGTHDETDERPRLLWFVSTCPTPRSR